jgi:hypothetical protein
MQVTVYKAVADVPSIGAKAGEFVLDPGTGWLCVFRGASKNQLAPEDGFRLQPIPPHAAQASLHTTFGTDFGTNGPEAAPLQVGDRVRTIRAEMVPLPHGRQWWIPKGATGTVRATDYPCPAEHPIYVQLDHYNFYSFKPEDLERVPAGGQ